MVKCYLFDPRRKHAQSVPQDKIRHCINVLKGRKHSIPFAYLLEDQTGSTSSNIFGPVPNGSLLSYQLKDHDKDKFAFSLNEQVTCAPEPLPDLETLPCPRLPNEAAPPLLFTNIASLNLVMQRVFEKIAVNLESARNIEANTVNQSDSPQWFSHRQMRLTASKFGLVLKRKALPNDKFLSSLFQQKDLSHVTAIKEGRDKEPLVARKYVKLMAKRKDRNVAVYASGLVVNPGFPFLGASPDRKSSGSEICLAIWINGNKSYV